MPGERIETLSELERAFWERVTFTDTGCWEWQGGRDQQGYGTLHLGDRRMGRAHRVSWAFANGPIPAGIMVLHRCDNPPCVRPSHLFLGTARDNAHDAIAKGRFKGRADFLTHCHRGHPVTPENTQIDSRGWRVCRVCRRKASRDERRVA